MLNYLAAFALPALLVLLFTPAVIRFAFRFGAVDVPDARKVHSKPVPRLGGLVIFLSVGLSLLLFYHFLPMFSGVRESLATENVLIGFALLSIFLLGAVDDLRSLRPELKFSVQFLVALLVYAAGFRISMITHPFGGEMLALGWFDVPLTVLWLVGVTNAFNLIDGLDGLAAGVAVIACAAITLLALLAGDSFTALFTLMLAGALVGFLRYNFHPASIFMGDSGSLFIGFSLALISLQTTTKLSTGFTLLIPLLVLMLPIMDTVISMARRLLGSCLPGRGEANGNGSLFRKLYGMFVPDRAHIHHQLLMLGLSHRNAVLVLYGVSAFFAAGALVLTRSDQPEQSLAFLFIFGFALFLGVKQLRYHEIAILNNGLLLPFYKWWTGNRTLLPWLTDIGFIVISFLLTLQMMRIGGWIAWEEGLSPGLAVTVLVIQFAVLQLTGIYREEIRSLAIGNALAITAMVAYAVLAGTLALLMSGVIAPAVLLPFLFLNFYLLLTFVLGFRISYQAMRYWFSRDKRTGIQILIYGANERGKALIDDLSRSTGEDYRIVGFLDDDPGKAGKKMYGYPVFGGHWKLPRLLDREQIDWICLCDEKIRPENLKRLRSIAESRNVEIRKVQIRFESVLNESSKPVPELPHRIVKGAVSPA